jgi:hypothetical protein
VVLWINISLVPGDLLPKNEVGLSVWRKVKDSRRYGFHSTGTDLNLWLAFTFRRIRILDGWFAFNACRTY